jgi:maltooligosyltrehalose trehalohydrolase
MAVFEVWAPGHRQVELLLDCGKLRLPMESCSRGSWRVEVEGLRPGTRYAFSLDGGPARPDPRSRWQPEGIDGPSALVEEGFAWTDEHWKGFNFAGAVLYELHVGTFSEQGTFEGAIAHLDHLVSLGVNAVELMPVAEASGERGWGYDGVDLWAPHHAYGGPQGLKRLVDACHARGLAVVLDVVYNHLGPAGNYLPEFGPYFTDRYRTPWGSAVNFDGAGSYGVREFVISNALMWLSDYHMDGLRLDAVHAVHDESALHVVEELCAAVDELAASQGKKLWVILESDRNDPRAVRPRDLYGWGADACWDDDFHHAVHTLLTGERSGYYADFGLVGDLAKAMRDAYVYDGRFSEFRQRRHGRPAEGLAGSSFVVFLQNHDQVGNRAHGDRLSSLVGTDLLKVGAALLVLSPYVPMLFQGEEWGASSPFLYFTDHHDPELGRAVSEGRRREHRVSPGEEVPDPQALSSFLRSKLDWSELSSEPHRSLFAWYRRLLSLRRSEADFSTLDRAAVSTDFDEADRWLVVRRGRFSVAANLGGEARAVPLGSWGNLVLASEGSTRLEGPTAWLPPRSVAVVAH